MKKRSKRLLSRTLSLAAALSLTVPAARAAEITVTEALEPKYDDMQAFSEGFAAVCLDGKWGVLAVGTGSAPAPGPRTAYPPTQTVMADGSPVTFNAYALKDEDGNDTNYVKLRDLGSALGFLADWNAVDGIVIKTR